MTVIIQECAGYLEERFQIEQCPIDAGSPLGNGFLCPLEFEQPDMGKTWHEHDMRRLTRQATACDPVLHNVHRAGQDIEITRCGNP